MWEIRMEVGELRELCGVKNGMNRSIDQSVLLWFGNIERNGNSKLATNV